MEFPKSGHDEWTQRGKWMTNNGGCPRKDKDWKVIWILPVLFSFSKFGSSKVLIRRTKRRKADTQLWGISRQTRLRLTLQIIMSWQLTACTYVRKFSTILRHVFMGHPLMKPAELFSSKMKLELHRVVTIKYYDLGKPGRIYVCQAQVVPT